MRNFEILFDDAEPSSCDDPAYERYGKLAFPRPSSDRPWIYSNFVQSLDGIASFKGRHATGGDISQLPEDRWLMDFLRAHADAILLGINTLMEETQLLGKRGPVYSIEDAALRKLRENLGLGREKNIFVTGAAYLDLHDYRVFDSDSVESFIITTSVGARRLADKESHPRVKVIVAGQGAFVDLAQAMRILRQDYGINRLLCEGGPTLYGYMSRGGFDRRKISDDFPARNRNVCAARTGALGCGEEQSTKRALYNFHGARLRERECAVLAVVEFPPYCRPPVQSVPKKKTRK